MQKLLFGSAFGMTSLTSSVHALKFSEKLLEI